MVRRLSSIAFALALVFVAACGHQVTPNPTLDQSDLAGKITVKFQVNGPLDFTNVTYAIAIDTCGYGVPYPQALFSGYASYSFAFLVGGGFGNSAEPELFQYYLNPSSAGLFRALVNNLNPSTTQFVANYNGQGTEFSLTFPRSALNDPLTIHYPCPNSTVPEPTPAPTAAATPTATSTGGASPTPSASGVPSDSTGVYSPPYLTTWTFNMLTFSPQPNSQPLDSLGPGGPTDVETPGIVVDTTTTNTFPFYRNPPNATPANQSAYITYAEVDTYAGP